MEELLAAGPPRLRRTVHAMAQCDRQALIDDQQRHPLQRPSLFIYPEILSVPFFRGDQHPLFDHLLHVLQDESNLALIKQECQQIFFPASCDDDTSHPSHQQQQPPTMLANRNEPLLDRIYSSTNSSGTWNAFYFVNQGTIDQDRVALCPNTWNILQQAFPDDALCTGSGIGYVYFSRIKPGTHILPHCGVCNLKLRLQLPLFVDSNHEVKIRVANEWRTYAEGRAMIFDDTFDHEVIFRGKVSDDDGEGESDGDHGNDEGAANVDDEHDRDNEAMSGEGSEESAKTEGVMDRIVLLVDFWHPELNDCEIRATQLLLPPP